MFLYLSKVIPLFLYPPGLTLVLLALAAIIRRRRPALSASLYVLALTSIYALSLPIVADSLMASLESKYPSQGIDQAPTAGAIVVLGGYMHSPNARHKDIEFEASVDRLWMGARLYRAGKAPFVLLTGGNLAFLGETGMPEAIAAKGVLRDWGVPEQAILVEDKSQNTRENAVFSKQVLDARQVKNILLVTSSFHMPRAVAIFQRAGMTATPVPTDFQSGWGQGAGLFSFLPDAEFLYKSKLALKEWLGLYVYRIRGWA